MATATPPDKGSGWARVAGVAAVEEICAVDGLDGIFLGPNDLGASYGKGISLDTRDSTVLAAIERCRIVAGKHGRHAGIFCSSGQSAAAKVAQGFDFVVPNSEANILKRAMAAEVKAVRQAARVP